MNEQENKFKDSETSITALQVNVIPSLFIETSILSSFYDYIVFKFLKL